MKYGGDTVPQAPFRVNANPTGNANKCKVTGPGVKNPSVGKPTEFEVDATKAGKGSNILFSGFTIVSKFICMLIAQLSQLSPVFFRFALKSIPCVRLARLKSFFVVESNFLDVNARYVDFKEVMHGSLEA